MKIFQLLLFFTILGITVASLDHTRIAHHGGYRKRNNNNDGSNEYSEMLSQLDKHNDNHEQTGYDGMQSLASDLENQEAVQHQHSSSNMDHTHVLVNATLNPRGNWKEAVKKAKQLISQLSLEERVNLTTGLGWSLGPKPRCVGNIGANKKINFPGLCLEDSPAGVRFADLASVFPSGVTTAATFSSNLTFARGKALGREAKTKGVNVLLAPGMNIVRTPAGGRNWEYGGGDPFLSGESAFHTIQGIQSQGVQACAKHLVGNEQEIGRSTYSSNIDGRTLREIYLHPFLRSVQADVASIMCSYNLLNNSWACQDSELMNGNVKTEMGFSGYILSDWGAQHSGALSAQSGLDMTMPGQVDCCDASNVGSYWGPNLTMAVKNGSVEASRLEDMSTRILAGWILTGQDKNYPLPNFDAFDAFYGDHINAVTVKHSELNREIAAAGSVLLKNKNHALPLKRNMRKMAVVGEDAGPSRGGANEFPDRGGVDGIVGIGWGSGTAEYSYLISPYEALQQRARQYHTGFYWSLNNFATGHAMTISDQRAGVDAAIVFVHADSGEGYINVDGNQGDRNNLTLWANGENLIQNVTSVNNNTIVVIHAPSQIDVEQWIDNPNVTAVIHAHFGGSEAGNAIADILFGDVNPSGRLPYTIAKQRSDYPADVEYFTSTDTAKSQIDYKEKLLVDYRYFDKANIQPRFAFGHGLSYTTFKYSNVQGQWINNSGPKDDWNTRNWTLPYPDWLFEEVYQVSFHVANVGKMDGFEVPQLYLGFPSQAGEPPKVLRGFDRFAIKAGQSKQITFKLKRYDLSYWDEVNARWMKPQGDFNIFIGASSRDIRLTKSGL